MDAPLKVLIFCNPWFLQVNYKRDLLRAWKQHSQNKIYFSADFTDSVPGFHSLAKPDYDLNWFDVVVVDRSIWVSFGYASSRLERGLDTYKGVKVLFINDDYYSTEVTRNWIEQRGIDFVVTAIPEEYIGKVYPAERFPYTRFASMLPGYVPIDESLHYFDRTPLAERAYDVVYQGRHWSRWMGELVREKWLIGREMKDVCKQYGLKQDIRWEEQERVFGVGWYRFLQSGRATLGTESGANVFDEHGKIKAYFDEQGARGEDAVDISAIPPELNYREENIGVRMNQLSPKLFEAITLGTALVLFEGDYSGILEPGLHYIPLKKDFSNITEVVKKIKDTDYLQTMTERAYEDVIRSEKYGYERFIIRIEREIEDIVRGKNGEVACKNIFLRESTPDMATLEEILVSGMLARQAQVEQLKIKGEEHRSLREHYRNAHREKVARLEELRGTLKAVRAQMVELRLQLRQERGANSRSKIQMREKRSANSRGQIRLQGLKSIGRRLKNRIGRND